MNCDALIRVWGNELFIVTVLLLAYAGCRFLPQLKGVSFLAVASACCVVFNPYVAHKILGSMGVRTFLMFSFPSTYIVPLIGIVLWHVALRRIKRAQTHRSGAGRLLGLVVVLDIC
jgi:hypothetical protein